MKSDVFSSELGFEVILSEIERAGEYCMLSSEDTSKLRLLAEEMMELTVRLFDKLSYELQIENEGKNFKLILTVNTLVSANQKEKILSLSSSGKNIAGRGVLGIISETFQNLIILSRESADNMYPLLNMYGGHSGYDCSEPMYFSLVDYRSTLLKEDGKEKWDGLEKSIIANLASDITIGVKNDQVVITAFINFLA